MPPAQTGRETSRKQCTVLLVEDDPETYELYSDVLAAAGFSVFGADCGDDVLHQTLRHRPDLVVMDYELRGMNGAEALELLKRDARTRHVPVVMLTGHFARQPFDRATKAGCESFLTKPCTIDTLLGEVRRLLDGDGPTRGSSVLVIEDDDEIRGAVASLLGDAGMTVLEAANGRDGLACLRTAAPLPSLVLLDLMMPVMDGWAFRTAQLSDPRLADIPVIILSATQDGSAQAEALRADQFLAKPLDLPQLLRAVDKHVSS